MSESNRKSVFDFEDYKAYVIHALNSSPQGGRGVRTRLAQSIMCNTTYISHVLNGNADFSLEQAARINAFLHHTKKEGRFFILLVLYGRAGSAELKEYFREQMNEAYEQQATLKNRLTFHRKISKEDEASLYSAWYYIAVHSLISMPEFEIPSSVANHLKLPTERVLEILAFLTARGLAVQDGNRFRSSQISFHLGNDSPMISRHHVNWRMQAISALDAGSAGSKDAKHLHYSSVVTVAEGDVPKVRAHLVDAIEKIRAVVHESKEDRLYCYNLDLFEVGSTLKST